VTPPLAPVIEPIAVKPKVYVAPARPPKQDRN